MCAIPARPSAPSARFPTSTPKLYHRINGNATNAYPGLLSTMENVLRLVQMVRWFRATERPALLAPMDAQPASAARASVGLAALANSPSTGNASPPARPTPFPQTDPAPPATQTARPAQDPASTNAGLVHPTIPCSRAAAAVSPLAAGPSTSTSHRARANHAIRLAARALLVAQPDA
jgi:hypothetical protein